ncbi:MAG: SMC-Scp complex subunit ScpB [Nanoarchaeota archaeon]|nr:SMC-Scp complex subunit ScpB [Nanoarchaeota archaeon]
MEEPLPTTHYPLPTISKATAEEIETEFEDNEQESAQKVEAALFVAGRFLDLQELIVLTDVNPIMLKSILHNLEKKYSTGVIRIIRRTNSWKMDISEKFHYLINKLASGNTEFTKAEQETLAIIAYKQPVKQSVVIKIRGNKSYDHIKKFRDLGLVTTKQVGHTLELSLSEEFYEYFNVDKATPREEQGAEQ